MLSAWSFQIIRSGSEPASPRACCIGKPPSNSVTRRAVQRRRNARAASSDPAHTASGIGRQQPVTVIRDPPRVRRV
jgi:hypothetical protein